jgi:hypothetical protein
MPCQSLVFATDHKDKGKNAVYTFLKKIADMLKDHDIGQKLILYTDGPASEFKNRYSLKILSEMSSILQCEVEWKFFATSHGKGVVDGIGGKVKSVVRQQVLSKKNEVIVQNASDFVITAKQHLTNIQIIEVTEDEIDDINKQLWDEVQAVPGISKMHCIACKSGKCKMYPSEIELKQDTEVANQCTVDLTTEADTCISVFRVGDWVLISYDSKVYPGEVTVIGKDDVQVSVMHRTFNQNWKWPDKSDKIFYKMSDILRKIAPPVPVGNRGQYKFEENFEF